MKYCVNYLCDCRKNIKDVGLNDTLLFDFADFNSDRSICGQQLPESCKSNQRKLWADVVKQGHSKTCLQKSKIKKNHLSLPTKSSLSRPSSTCNISPLPTKHSFKKRANATKLNDPCVDKVSSRQILSPNRFSILMDATENEIADGSTADFSPHDDTSGEIVFPIVGDSCIGNSRSLPQGGTCIENGSRFLPQGGTCSRSDSRFLPNGGTSDSTTDTSVTKKKTKRANRKLITPVLNSNSENITELRKNNTLRAAFLNIRSVREKQEIIKDYIAQKRIDVLFLAETWLYQKEDPKLAPVGYKFRSKPRLNKTGGGLGILYRENMNIKFPKCQRYNSMETQECVISEGNVSIRFVSVYRAESGEGNEYKMSEFYDECTRMLSFYQKFQNETVFCGDYNFHMNKPWKDDVKKFNEILDIFDKHNIIEEPTHEKGNTLDLVIVGNNSMLRSHEVGSRLSDHHAIIMNLDMKKPERQKKTISFRKIKDIDKDKFKEDVAQKIQSIDLEQDIGQLVHDYNCILKETLDEHAPLQTKEITVRERTPWTNEDLRPWKTERRRLERKWRKNRLHVDRQTYSEFNRNYGTFLNNMRTEDYKKQIDDNKDDPKGLFKVVNNALHKGKDNPMPPNVSKHELADNFIDFFDNKIKDLRIILDNDGSQTQTSIEEIPKYMSKLSKFRELSNDEVKNLLVKSSNKHCDLDPIPTTLLKDCMTDLLPLISKIVNLSLILGEVPEELKEAMIRPLLKKLGLELINKNYRPVSNLPFISKLIEQAVALQLIEHLKINKLYDDLQSAYRQLHSTETALLRVKNDILMEMDKQKVVLLLLLDLSAAFDTIDHTILLNRLEKRCGISGTALKWFASYLSKRKQFVKVGDTESERRDLIFGVPQGSVLGPILFCIYISPLGEIIEKEGMERQEYADDTGLYTSFSPKQAQSKNEMLNKVQKCLSAVKRFLFENKLKVNDDKTVLMLLGNKYWLDQLDFESIYVGDTSIKAVDNTRNLGIIFDREMTFEDHIKKTCQKGYSNIKNLFYLGKFLDKPYRNIVAHSFITSILDYGNSLLYGLRYYTKLNRLQMLQNAAVRSVVKKRKFDRGISQDRADLNWLPVEARTKFKLALIIWKCLKYGEPVYLRNLLNLHTDGRHPYRNTLKVPKTNTVSWGDVSFEKAAPILWNSLPDKVRYQNTKESFKKALKTHLFSIYGTESHLVYQT